MILVLSGADFSENNLGQVEVTTILDDFTLAAIEASGNVSMTDVQKSALNTFFKKIGAFGADSQIFSKMRYLYLPMLASDLAHSMVNYVNNDNSIVPSNTKFQLRNKGITGVSGGSSAYFSITDNNGFDGDNISMGAIRMEFFNNNSILARVGSTNPGRMEFKFIKTGAGGMNLNSVKDSGGTIFSNVPIVASDNTSKGLFGAFSIDNSLSNNVKVSTDIRNETATGEPSTSIVASTTKDLSIFLGFSSGNTSGITDAQASTGMLFVGTAMTKEELKIIRIATTNLRIAFL